MNERVLGKLRSTQTLFFVCSGNIIRSSFAELYAKHHGLKNIHSYGTTYHNSTIHPKSRKKLLELGVNKQLVDDFIPRHIVDIAKSLLLDNDSLHIVMTDQHIKELLRNEINRKNIIKLNEFNQSTKDVVDPYFNQNWEEAFSSIITAVDQIVAVIT